MNIQMDHKQKQIPLIMGHYLPWFTGGSTYAFMSDIKACRDIEIPRIETWRHWRDSRSLYKRTHLSQPYWGEYDSRNPIIIHRQIMFAKQYGLDGFIINLNGKNSVENLIGLIFLDELKKYNAVHYDDPFFYCVSFDAQAQWPTEGKVPVTLVEDFQYLKEVWLSEYYIQIDGKPVLLIFPYDKPCREYRHAVDQVFGVDQIDIIWSGTDAAGQNAAYPWIRPSEIDEYGRWLDPDDAGDIELKNFYTSSQLNPDIKYLIGGVWPGFNDQLVKWAWNNQTVDPMIRPRLICRETTRGNTLELTWQVTLDYLHAYWQGSQQSLLPMPIIQLITWNDWAESTQIEPDKETGFQALSTCSEFIKKIKSQQNEGNRNEENYLLVSGNLCLEY